MALRSNGWGTELRLLPKDWKAQRLGEVCDVKGRIGWRGYTVDDLRESGPLVLGATQITSDNRLDLSKPTFLSREKFEESPEIKIDQWDILVVKVGNTIGKVAIVTDDLGEACINPNTVLLKRISVEPRFLFYHLTDRYSQHFLRAHSAASAQPAINQTVLKTMLVPVPPLEQQRAIAAMLGALDDKIELNRRMNATLEAMARALFQSWFVDFDPVRAKLDGGQLIGLDPATAALFPNEFEDSELGPIPRGWRVRKLDEILAFSRETVDAAKQPNESFEHYSLPAFDEGRTPKLQRGEAIKSQKLFVPRDAVLLSKLNPHIPRIWLPDIGNVARAVCSTEFLVARPKVDFSREFLFCLFTSSQFASEYVALVTGTTGSHQRVKSESVLQVKLALPETELIERFSTIAHPMFRRINDNTREALSLAATRDALLPKLLNGDLRIPKLNTL